MDEVFKLWLVPSSTGDGGCSINKFASEEEAETYEESLDEGWGESTATSINLKVIDGVIHFEKTTYVTVNKKFTRKVEWVPLKAK